MFHNNVAQSYTYTPTEVGPELTSTSTHRRDYPHGSFLLRIFRCITGLASAICFLSLRTRISTPRSEKCCKTYSKCGQHHAQKGGNQLRPVPVVLQLSPMWPPPHLQENVCSRRLSQVCEHQGNWSWWFCSCRRWGHHHTCPKQFVASLRIIRITVCKQNKGDSIQRVRMFVLADYSQSASIRATGPGGFAAVADVATTTPARKDL